MAENFDVKPGHLAGFAVMSADLTSQLSDVMGHVNYEARLTDARGLMELLKAPTDDYAWETTERIASRLEPLSGLQTELNRAAWDYSGADEESYVLSADLMPHLPGGAAAPPQYRDFTDPVAYSSGTEPSLEPPELEEADIKGVLDEVGGSINAIDDIISFVTGWSPVSELVEPMSGNWNEISRAGEVLTQAGDGAEQVSDNYDAAVARLSGAWHGGAAVAFEDFSSRLSAAIRIEGPINRLVGRVYVRVADEFQRVAEFMVTTLKTAVDKIASAVATGWIPFYGWKKAYDAVRSVIDILQEAYQLVQDLQAAIETVQTVVEAAKDPVGFVQGQVEEKLQPLIDGAEIAGDVSQLDPSAITDAPDGDYAVGPQPRRAG